LALPVRRSRKGALLLSAPVALLVAYLVWDVLSAPTAPATMQDAMRKPASSGEAPRHRAVDRGAGAANPETWFEHPGVRGNAIHGNAGSDATPQARDLRPGVEVTGFGAEGSPPELAGGEPRAESANREAISIVGATTRGPVMQSR
jgi:hypothetical protein